MIPASGGVSGWAGLIPQSGLVNAWPFDSTYTTSSLATDPIGGKNATLTSVTLNGSGPGTNLNNAAVFTGSTPSGGLTSLTTYPTTALTVSLWVKPNSGMGGNARPIAVGNPGSQGWDLYLNLGSSSYWVFGNGSGATLVGAQKNLTAGSWIMLTATFSGSTITTYGNGSSYSSGSFTGPISPSTDDRL